MNIKKLNIKQNKPHGFQRFHPKIKKKNPFFKINNCSSFQNPPPKKKCSHCSKPSKRRLVVGGGFVVGGWGSHRVDAYLFSFYFANVAPRARNDTPGHPSRHAAHRSNRLVAHMTHKNQHACLMRPPRSAEA